MQKEEWINEVLKSTDGMIKISPDDALFFKIQNRINDNKLSSRWIWLAAASFVILVSLNLKFVFGKANSKESQTEVLAATITKSNQLY
ncbi:hypothetical protein [Flavobacterium sp.]|uniref:hypothetical protein n=1 Tax=Flavobacterium sp. TaxID=239 RepID=UPI00286E32FD|nr:hypothetical protein [Flavobacterium sp.]